MQKTHAKAQAQQRSRRLRGDSQAQDDQRLIKAAALGSTDAFRALYERHSPHMLALGIRILANPSDAEEVLQEVAVEVWRHVQNYEPSRGAVRAWLAIRMRTRCYDRFRKRKLRTQLPNEVTPTTCTAITNDNNIVDRWSVHQLLATVSPDHGEVLKLRYLQDLNNNDVAHRLSIPVNTVKSRVNRALTQMRTRAAESHRAPPATCRQSSVQTGSSHTEPYRRHRR